jgi:hypothetical protein
LQRPSLFAQRGRDNRPIAPPLLPSPPRREQTTASGARWRRTALLIAPGENPSGAIYGLIVIAALLAAESGRHETYLETFASGVIAACLYWLAHAYATVLGKRLMSRQHLTALALARALAHDWAIMRGASVPLLALLIAWIAGASQQAAVNAALWSAAAGLVVLELAAGSRVHNRRGELVLEVCVGLALGLGVIALRVVLH